VKLRAWICAFLVAIGTAWGGDLRVGRASVDITPPPGMPMGGYFELRLNTGIHDPLLAKALVLEEDGVKAALVACDLESLPHEFVDAARRLIEKTTGLRGDHVLISATHTHTGPEMSHQFLDQVEGAPAQVAKEYRTALPGKIAEVVKLADANLRPARAWAATGREGSLSFNRRYLMKDGTVRFNPGKLNPEIVRPMGPIDPDVSVVYFDSEDAKPLATFVNFALHLDTVGGTDYSADYPSTLGRLLAGYKGPEMLTVFTIGCAGNVNHLDVNSALPQTGQYEASRIGTTLAAAVLKTFRKLSPVEGPLAVHREVVKLPVQEVKTGEVENARNLLRRAIRQGDKDIPFLDLVRAYKALNVAEYQGRPIEAEVQVMSLGNDLAWVGLPGEIFVELGLAIKLASPFPYTIVSELSNDVIDYVPDQKAFAQGAYEVITARCQPGCGEVLVDAATRLLLNARHFPPSN
jgi:neutral ceramidase